MPTLTALRLIWAVCIFSSAWQVLATHTPHVAPRLPVNARCPHHGYPFRDRTFAQYVRNHPLTQPGLTEHMAQADPVWFSKAITEFVFTTADHAARYFKRIGPINGQRPFEFNLDCSSPKFQGILSGKARAHPATIIWGSRFNFETPLLLFRLHTYKDIVDYHFISETTRVDFSQTPKPLMFERVKGHLQEFLPQIVHHVVDGTSYGGPFNWTRASSTATADVWHHEGHHFRSILKPLLDTFKNYPSDSIVLHGDIDEVPDEDFVFHMKHCELQPGVQFPIRSNAVMWAFDHRYIMKTGYHDAPTPFSFKYPLFFSLAYLRQQDATKFNWRAAGSLSPSLPGGWHFSYMLFPPSFYMKLVSMAESGGRRFFSGHVSVDPQFIDRELARRRDDGWFWGSKAITHPTCLVKQYPQYQDFVDTVPWLIAQNVQQFAFFVPCQPAFYDKQNKLETDYANCQRLFGPG